MPRLSPTVRALLQIGLGLAACRPPAEDDVGAEDTDVATFDTDAPVAGLVLGPEVRCPDASLRDRLGPYATTHLAMDSHAWVGFHGLGVGIADLDGDGAPEIVLPGPETTRMVRWTAAGPVDVRDRLGDADLTDANGVIPVDLEGDGDLDLFVLRHSLPNVVLLNDGAGRFADGTARSGLAGGGQDATMGATFADIDQDGDLDAFVASYSELDLTGPEVVDWPAAPENHLYENVGDGVFVDRSDLLPPEARAGLSFMGAFLDLDDDGRWELYVTHDFGEERVPNVLLSVDGFDVTLVEGTGLELAFESMGLAVGDLDGDGADELMLPAWGRLAVMSRHSGLWFDDTDAYGMRAIDKERSRVGWGNAIVDLDNDGLREAFMTYGFIEVRDRWRNGVDQPDVLWRRDAAGVWGDQAPAWGLDDRRSTRGLALADLDGNGILDVVRPNLDDGDAISLGRCDAHAWLDLSFTARGANPFGVGARVRLTDGDTTWTGTVRAGGGAIGSGEPPTLHFGLGDRDAVARVEVRWPDGTTSTYDDVPARRSVRVVQAGR